MTPTAAGRRPRLRGVLLAVVALATMLGLSAMHVLPMSMPGAPSSAMSMGAVSMSVLSMSRVVTAPAPVAAHEVGRHVGSGVRDCGMGHAGCLATLTAQAPAHVPAAVRVCALESPQLPAAQRAAAPVPGPSPPDLSELCISRT